jgi:choice-of-anchor B domain-containing protein
MAGDFPCAGIDLRKRVPLAAMGGGAGNDLWGWADPDTGHEYALVGMNNGTAFVDVTEPEAPVYLGRLPTRTFSSTWRGHQGLPEPCLHRGRRRRRARYAGL